VTGLPAQAAEDVALNKAVGISFTWMVLADEEKHPNSVTSKLIL
jgi:hypothetical protein